MSVYSCPDLVHTASTSRGGTFYLLARLGGKGRREAIKKAGLPPSVCLSNFAASRVMAVAVQIAANAPNYDHPLRESPGAGKPGTREAPGAPRSEWAERGCSGASRWCGSVADRDQHGAPGTPPERRSAADFSLRPSTSASSAACERRGRSGSWSGCSNRRARARGAVSACGSSVDVLDVEDAIRDACRR